MASLASSDKDSVSLHSIPKFSEGSMQSISKSSKREARTKIKKPLEKGIIVNKFIDALEQEAEEYIASDEEETTRGLLVR